MVRDRDVPAADELAKQLKLVCDGGIRPFGEKHVGVLQDRHSVSVRFGGERVADATREPASQLAVFI
jgi:hypothetical protein